MHASFEYCTDPGKVALRRYCLQTSMFLGLFLSFCVTANHRYNFSSQILPSCKAHEVPMHFFGEEDGCNVDCRVDFCGSYSSRSTAHWNSARGSQPAKAACVIFKEGSAMEHKSYPTILRGLLLLLFAIIPTVVMCICYFKIFREVGEHLKRVAPNLAQSPSRRKSRANSREMRTTITLFAVVVMFVLSWLPVFVIEIIQAFAIDWWEIPREVQLLWTFFGSFRSAANPLVYGLANSSYHREYKRLLTFKWKKTKSDGMGNNEASRSVSVVSVTFNSPS